LLNPRLLSVGRRSLELLTAARMTGNLYELLYRLNSLDGRAGNDVFELRYSWIRDPDLPVSGCGMLDFKPTCMRPLFEAGRDAGNTAWSNSPPPL
jgi:hypothetical protein